MVKLSESTVLGGMGIAAGIGAGYRFLKQISDEVKADKEKDRKFQIAKAQEFEKNTGVPLSVLNEALGDKILFRAGNADAAEIDTALGTFNIGGRTFYEVCNKLMDLYQRGDLDSWRKVKELKAEKREEYSHFMRGYRGYRFVKGFEPGDGDGKKRHWYLIAIDGRFKEVQFSADTPEQLFRQMIGEGGGYGRYQRAEDRVWWLPFTW